MSHHKMFIPLVGDVVAIYIPSTIKSISTVTEEVVSPEVSQLNHTVMNKSLEITYSFFQKKRL